MEVVYIQYKNRIGIVIENGKQVLKTNFVIDTNYHNLQKGLEL